MELQLHRRAIDDDPEPTCEEGVRHPPRHPPSNLLVRLFERNPQTRAPRFQSTMFDMEGY